MDAQGSSGLTSRQVLKARHVTRTVNTVMRDGQGKLTAVQVAAALPTDVQMAATGYHAGMQSPFGFGRLVYRLTAEGLPACSIGDGQANLLTTWAAAVTGLYAVLQTESDRTFWAEWREALLYNWVVMMGFLYEWLTYSHVQPSDASPLIMTLRGNAGVIRRLLQAHDAGLDWLDNHTPVWTPDEVFDPDVLAAIRAKLSSLL